jgi:hypothetical protein
MRRGLVFVVSGSVEWMVVAVALVALVGSGCLQAAAPAETPEPEPGPSYPARMYQVPAKPTYDFSKAFDVAHAHEVRQLHTNSYGLTLVGYNDLLAGLQPGVWAGGFIEVDVRGDLAVVSILTGPHAFVLVDISDLTKPTVLSHFYSSNDNWDSRISDDGNYVFVGCQGTGLYTFAPVGQCTDYNGVPSPTGTQDQGIITVDIKDRRSPKALCYTPSSSVHNLETVTDRNGTIIVANNGGEIFTMKADGCLEFQSKVPGSHDVSLQHHPITGELLLYTGAGELTVFNIENITKPVALGSFDSNGVKGATAGHEQTPAPSVVEGHHLLIGGSERFTGAPGPVTVINMTDPHSAAAMGTWILPVPGAAGNPATYNQASYMFSEHNAAVSIHGQVCVGHYHAGLWVFDASTPERMAQPVTLAFYLPHEITTAVSTIHPAGGNMLPSPYVWGCAFTEDGTHVVVTDMHSGIYILKADWLVPVEPA